MYNPQTLLQLARNLPVTEDEMLEVPGVTPVNFSNWGHQFLKVTMKYAEMQLGEFKYYTLCNVYNFYKCMDEQSL